MAPAQVEAPDASVAFYDSIAPHYDEHLSAISGDAWVRAAFHAFVVKRVPPGAHLLDFGCGTGTDAVWYAAQGYSVVAYDNSAGMISELQHKCAREIAQGRVMSCYAPYGEFLAHSQVSCTHVTGIQAITSNFAALNLIDPLAPLFAVFASMLVPHGLVMVSVVNPFFWKEMIHPTWWRINRVNFKKRTVRPRESASNVVRHFVSRMDMAATSAFKRVDLASVGMFVRYGKVRDAWGQATSLPARIESRLWRTPLINRTGKYLFLAYRRVT